MFNCTHVYTECDKTTPLGPNFEGPYPIVGREGTSCIKVKKGTYVNGEDRVQLWHWNNCKPANFLDTPFEVQAPKLGRPNKQ